MLSYKFNVIYGGILCWLIMDDVKLPIGQRVVVTVLDDIIADRFISENRVQIQRKAFEDFLLAIDTIDDEQLGDEFDQILSQKFNIKRELDL